MRLAPRSLARTANVVKTAPSGSVLDQIGRHLPLPLPVPDWSKPIILLLLLIAAGFAIRARLASMRMHRLEAHQEGLAADLDSMQATLVPRIPPQLGDLKISVAYRPADGPAAGGDFYDVFLLGGDSVAIILGDVSGHGRGALAHATHMRYALRAYVEAGLGPRAALNLAGRVLDPGQQDLFATVVVAVYDSQSASLTYATAGHPPPLMLGTPAPEPLTSCASPALGWGVPAGRRQTTVPFPTGARACFFSDGLTEAQTDAGLLGRSRLERHFAHLNAESSAPALLERIQDEAKELRDDMAACVVQAAAGTATSTGTLEELELDLDQAAGGQAKRFLEACGVEADEAARVVDTARAIASEYGGALLKVQLSDESAAASASSPARESNTAALVA